MSLPDWAIKALKQNAPHTAVGETEPNYDAVMDHKILEKRVKDNWAILNAEFVPDIEELSDIGKQIIFDRALFAAKYLNQESTNSMRDDKKILCDTYEEVNKKLNELVKLLNREVRIETEQSLSTDSPRVWDVLDKTFERYPEWKSVAQPELRKFMTKARTQSRVQPSMVDVLQVFFEMRFGNISSEFEAVIGGYQTSDAVLAMLDSIYRDIDSLRQFIPSNFKLTDRGIAALVTALMGVETNSESVKKTRQRLKARE